MKLVFKDIQQAPTSFMRMFGYFPDGQDEGTGELRFVRALAGRVGYPRFHIYALMEDGAIELNLHLDQKQPSYEGSRAHGGEYDGDTVEREAERIQRCFAGKKDMESGSGNDDQLLGCNFG